MAGLATIGRDTQSYVNGVPQFNTPNHNYDISDFDQLVSAISNHELPPSALPAVSFLKAPGNEDGHAGYSDPADEQEFIAHTIDEIMNTPDWSHTAIVINYDDSDGWYDHANSGVLNPSLSAADNLTDTTLSGPTSGQCGPKPQTATPLGGEQGRCGLGPRLPMLVISPLQRATPSITTSATRPRRSTSSSTTGTCRESPAPSTRRNRKSTNPSTSRLTSRECSISTARPIRDCRSTR